MLRPPIFAIAIVLSTLAVTSPALATTLACENPAHPRVLAGMSVNIPRNDEPAFAQQVRHFSEASGMTLGEVSVGDDSGRHWSERTLIFQNEHNTVVIYVRTRRNSTLARVTIEYSCERAEDWRPYWRAFRRFARNIG